MPKKYHSTHKRYVRKHPARLSMSAAGRHAVMYQSMPYRSSEPGFAARSFQIFSMSFGGVTPLGSSSGYFALNPMSIVQPLQGPGGVFNFNSATNGGSAATGASLTASYPQFTDFSSVYSAYRAHWFEVTITVTPALAGDAIQIVTLPYNQSNSASLSAGPANCQQLMGQPMSVSAMAMFGSPVAKIKSFCRPEVICGLTKAQIEAQVPTAVAAPNTNNPYAAYQWVRWNTCDGALLAGQLTWVVTLRVKIEGSNRNIQLT